MNIVFAVIRTNCASSNLGQVIKVELFAAKADAEKALDKDNCAKIQVDGRIGYWDSKKQLFSYVEEKQVK